MKHNDDNCTPTPALLPFRIVFDSKGTPLFQDKDGAIFAPEKIKFPIKGTKKIKYISNISVTGIIGSNYAVITLPDGSSYKIPLPDDEDE